MFTAKHAYEIIVEVPDQPGELNKIAKHIAEKGINLLAVCCYVQDSTGILRFITDQTQRTLDTLQEHSYSASSKAVVLLEGDNSPGMLKHAASKLTAENINISHVHASAPLNADTFLVVLNTDNNERALVLLHE